MGGLLLDTHVWLWGMAGSPRLPATLRRSIDEALEDLWLSPASVWELGLLVRRGRYEIDRPVRRWVSEALAVLPLREAPITNEVALVSEEVELSHRDPADRFLAATAIVYGLELMTVDPRLVAAPSVPTRSA